MPSLRVIDPGVSSIQGLGRYGSQRYGIAPGGAMDQMALAECNALTGRPAGAAAIEVGIAPARFLVEGEAVRLGFSGADRAIFIDDRPAALGETHLARPGEMISIRGARDGQYTYLSVQGGLQGAETATGSFEAGADAVRGRRSWVFKAGDRIAVLAPPSGQSEYRLGLRRRTTAAIRVVLGPQADAFSEAAIAHFLATPWIVSHASNRMAYRLDGARIEPLKGNDIVSDGTVTGNIQIPGSGQPIVILRDRGTIGGYPKIATIVSADIGRFAQTTVAARLTFEAITVLEAQTLARDFAFDLANLKTKLEAAGPLAQVTAQALLNSNVAGDAFDASDAMPDRSARAGEPGEAVPWTG